MQCVATVRMRNANTSVPCVSLVNEQVCNDCAPTPLGVQPCNLHCQRVYAVLKAVTDTHTHNHIRIHTIGMALPTRNDSATRRTQTTVITVVARYRI